MTPIPEASTRSRRILAASVLFVLLALIVLSGSFIWGLNQRQQDLRIICDTMVYHRNVIREVAIIGQETNPPAVAERYEAVLRMIPALECQDGKPQLREAP